MQIVYFEKENMDWVDLGDASCFLLLWKQFRMCMYDLDWGSSLA